MKKVLSFGLKLLVSGTLLYLFFSKVDIFKILNTLKQIKLPVFFAGFIIYTSTLFISTKRWSLFLPAFLKYSRLVSLYFVGSFFNTFLPGLVGGDAIKAYYLYKDRCEIGPSLASVFMDRYMGLTALALIGFIAFIGGHTYLQGTELFWLVPLFCGIFLIASLIFWKLNWGRIKFLNAFHTPLMEFKKRKDIIYKGLFLGLIIQSVVIISFYILSLSLGFDIKIIYFFLFIPLITVATAVPVSLSGLGIREAGFLILFTKTGLTEVEALSLSLLIFITMSIVSLIGGLEFLRLGKPPEREELEVESCPPRLIRLRRKN